MERLACRGNHFLTQLQGDDLRLCRFGANIPGQCAVAGKRTDLEDCRQLSVPHVLKVR